MKRIDVNETGEEKMMIHRATIKHNEKYAELFPTLGDLSDL